MAQGEFTQQSLFIQRENTLNYSNFVYVFPIGVTQDKQETQKKENTEWNGISFMAVLSIIRGHIFTHIGMCPGR